MSRTLCMGREKWKDETYLIEGFIMENNKLSSTYGENSIESYINLVYKDVQKFPGVGYIIRNTDRESTNYGYKALITEDMNILLEAYPKSDDEIAKEGAIDFCVCGNLIIKVEIDKKANEKYISSRISKIYRIVRTKSKTEDSESYSYRLAEVRGIIKKNLMGLKVLRWENQTIAYIARYEYSPKQNKGRRNYYSYNDHFNMVLYDRHLNPVLFTRKELQELEDIEYSNVTKRFGQSFEFENGSISKMLNFNGEPIIKIEKSLDSGEYKLIGLV